MIKSKSAGPQTLGRRFGASCPTPHGLAVRFFLYAAQCGAADSGLSFPTRYAIIGYGGLFRGGSNSFSVIYVATTVLVMLYVDSELFNTQSWRAVHNQTLIWCDASNFLVVR